MKNRRIRVLILGDQEVGKTSWVNSLVSVNQNDQQERVVAPVTLPPEMCVQTEDMTTVLIDTSSNPDHQNQVSEEIRDCDVILLFYDVSNMETIERLKQYWLPRINDISTKIPVIIVGNKIDKQDDIGNEDSIEQGSVKKVIIPLIKQFSQVQMGLECSAIKLPNTKDIIYCAQRAVLFPLAPLYDIINKQLKPDFERALTRIFRICDKDLDGTWKDQELIQFQLEVFRGELTKQDIKGIKEIIKEEINRNSIDRGITLEEFITLQKRCVELIKIQICWTILRHFGYDDSLELSEDLFKDELIYNKELGQSIELGDTSFDFLKDYFKRFENNNLISLDQLEDIFYPINRVPWQNFENLIELQEFQGIDGKNEKKYLNLESWIALWNYLTLQDHKLAFKYLKYLGYENSLQEAFYITNKKNCYSQIMKINTRSVFHICLIGPQKVGKSTILQRIMNQEFVNNPNPTTQHKTIIKTITMANQRIKTFIFTEIPENQIQEYFQSEQQYSVDLVGLVFDQEEKVQQFLQTHEKQIYSHIPRFIVKSKCDHKQSIDNIEFPQFLKAFSSEYTEVSAKQSNIDHLIRKTIIDLIEKPIKGLPQDIIIILKENDNFLRRKGDIIVIGVASAAVLGLIYYFSFKPKGGIKSLLGKIFRRKQI